jgi:hypothetical protein
LLEKILAIPYLLYETHKELHDLDEAGNLAINTKFETELARTVLSNAPTQALQKINQAIIQNLQDNRSELLQRNEALQRELIKYKICTEDDFQHKTAVNRLIELLRRDLDDPRVISECASLHLVFFNYNHFYNPKPRDIRVISADFDNCFECLDSESEASKLLMQDLKSSTQGANQVVVLSGSNRQSAKKDESLGEENQNGSSRKTLAKLATTKSTVECPWELDKALYVDHALGHEMGTAWEDNEISYPQDIDKVKLIEFQLAHLQEKFPNDLINFYFYEDREDILEEIQQALRNNGIHLPETVSLHLVHAKMTEKKGHEVEPFSPQIQKGYSVVGTATAMTLQQRLEQQRQTLHRKLRPKQPGEMFHEEIRGRQSVHNTYRTREFGITGQRHMPPWARSWHRHKATPHKYRARANPNSPLVKTLQAKKIPFIAGPSGTAADCLEGLQLLIPTLSLAEKQQYLNLLAAAEVAQGHHSFHEIILTACNASVFPDLLTGSDKPIWEQIDLTHSYEKFLSSAFKETPAYAELVSRYPQHLRPGRQKKEPCEQAILGRLIRIVKRIQKKTTERQSYKMLNNGGYWHSQLPLIPEITQPNFAMLSKQNIARIQRDLGDLTPKEKSFLARFHSQPIQLTHYTDALPQIVEANKLASNTLLAQTLGKGKYTDNSLDDKSLLGNGSFVFFRFELVHDGSKNSRFGRYHITLNGKHSQLLNSGWVSLFEMLDPCAPSIAKRLETRRGTRLRTGKNVGSSKEPDLNFTYGTEAMTTKSITKSFKLTNFIFYGRDIMQGIGLSMIRELRLIRNGSKSGRQYSNKKLALTATKDLTRLVSQIFRIEAKIPRSVELTNEKAQIVAPELMSDALRDGNITEVRRLLALGIDVNAPLTSGHPAIIELCMNFSENPSDTQIFDLLLKNSAALKEPDGKTILHTAAIYNNFTCLSHTLANTGVDLNQCDKEGKTALHYASEHNSLDSILLLMTKGADSCIRDLNGMTALALATRNNHREAATVLAVTHPEDLTIANKKGQKPSPYIISEKPNILSSVECGKLKDAFSHVPANAKYKNVTTPPCPQASFPSAYLEIAKHHLHIQACCNSESIN